MSHIKVKDHDNWVRDSETGAIICTNNAARDAALARRRHLKQKDERVDNTIEKVEMLSQRVSNIETMLEKMLSLLEKN